MINRIVPALGPEGYKTYQLISPISTHRRPATCKEVNCSRYANGWQSPIDITTPLGRSQANYIRLHSGRTFAVSNPDGPIVMFHFRSGQECFTPHTVSLEREPFYVVREGDWRGNPRGVGPQPRSEADWVDDFANHQIIISEAHERG